MNVAEVEPRVEVEKTALPQKQQIRRRPSRSRRARPAPPPTEPVQLLEAQVPHVERLLRILSVQAFALDLSMLGSGKTYTATAVAERLNAEEVVVVCPVSVKPKWMRMKRVHGLPVTRIISFCELRSIEGKQPKHGLLSRHDLRDRDDDEFRATPAWEKTVREKRTLLIMDEIQHLKNVSSQASSAKALMLPIVQQQQQQTQDGSVVSKALLMSGSPIDKQEQIVTLFRTTGVLRNRALASFNPGTGVRSYAGTYEIRDFCASIDYAATTRTLWTPWNLKAYAYALFQAALKPHITSGMPAPECKSRIHKVNACYRLDVPDDLEALRRSITNLTEACHYDPSRDTVNFNPPTAPNNNGNHNNHSLDSMRKVTSAMMSIESAKVTTFVRVARTYLSMFRRLKVVIGVNYNGSITRIRDALHDFSPLVLDGSLSASGRDRVLTRFQSPNSRFRLLIGNISVCSTGIDLDDKHGVYHRLALISPNYSTINLYQMGQRLLRADTQSDSELQFVFGKDACEYAILRALARKSSVMRDMSRESAEALYPGEYPFWTEGESAPLMTFQNQMAFRIQDAWKRAITDPAYLACRRRLMREFSEMETGII